MIDRGVFGSKIEEIKSRVDIVEQISEYVSLKKAGRNFIGICPFHKEKTPSFTVNREKQIFYCFGCGEGGNIFSFLMKFNQVSFPEALRHLAAKAGVALPGKAVTREEKNQASIKEQIIRINHRAANFFSSNLFSQTGKEAMEYLKTRGIKESVCREFLLGFANDSWSGLKDFFGRENTSLKLLEQAGLIVKKTEGNGGFYDRFRGRLMFPIVDIGGRIVAFGGRTIKNVEPKYINSPETAVYVKGKSLYGLEKTKDKIRQQGFAILVEGYFDLISLWNAGVFNVVASLGTALTKEHVELIRRYTSDVVVVFDPDEAGVKAVERSIDLFLSSNIHVKIAVLPDKDDPDAFIRKYGKAGFDELIINAQSMVDYYIEKVIGKGSTLEEKRSSLRKAIPFILSISDILERNLFVKRVSEKLGIDQDVLKREVNRSLKVSVATGNTTSGAKALDDIDTLELSLIVIMLDYPHKIHDIVQTGILEMFKCSELKIFGENITDALKSEGIEGFDRSFIVNNLSNAGMKEKLLQKMVSEISYDDAMIDKIIYDTIRQIKRKWYKEKHKMIKIMLIKAEEAGDHEQCAKLLSQKESLLREEKILPS